MRQKLAITLTLFASAALLAQTPLPLVAPGLKIPNGSGAVPLALDQYDGKPELVPVHHSTVEVNNHTGSNLAVGLVAGPFSKQKITTELAGIHARTALHDARPVFFVHLNQDPDPAGDSTNSDTMVWTVVQATVTKDHRVFAKIQFSQLATKTKRVEGLVESDVEAVEGGWTKITPKSSLVPGEYALMPVPRVPNTFSSVVYDFTLDPAAPNARDAVLPAP